MISITDKTLACLDKLPHNKLYLSKFLNFLIEMEVDAIELSEQMFDLLSPLPEYPAYILIPEKTRIQGLDNALCGDYLQTFKHLKGNFKFCPMNRFHCATALAAEWVISGAGNDIVSSFSGICGFAATEELIMILKINGLRKASKTYNFFPEMTKLFSKIIKKKIPKNKPVIGSKIFYVESGIHVDGILKNPVCYEPFSPESVGQKRKIVLGKQSGTASIRAKLAELKIKCTEENIVHILEQVKIKAMQKKGEVSNREFIKIAMERLI
jgi:homocitrate synthase NifV